MTKINFFTPIDYAALPKTCSQQALRNVEAYFNLGGKAAKVVQINASTHSTNVVIVQQKVSVIKVIALIASYFTIILPAIFLILKCALRSQHKFHVIPATSSLLNPNMPLPPHQKPSGSHHKPIVTVPPNQNPDIPNPVLNIDPASNTPIPTNPAQDLTPTPEPSTPSSTNVSPSASPAGTPGSTRRDGSRLSTKPGGSPSRGVSPRPGRRKPSGTIGLDVIKHQLRTNTLGKRSVKEIIVDARKTARANAIEKLAQGLNVTPAIQNSIESMMKQIVERTQKGHTEFSWIADPNKCNTLVFSIPALPNVVFKIGNPKWSTAAALNPASIGGMDAKNIAYANKCSTQRFENIIEMRQTLDLLKTKYLILPQAQMFEVSYLNMKFVVVAEQRLKFNSNIDVQKRLYNNPKMLEPAKELGTVTAMTGSDDLEFRNFPIEEEDPSYDGPPRICIIDCDSSSKTPEGKTMGLFGMPKYPGNPNGRTGLINMLYYDDQVEAVAEIAKRFEIVDMFDAKATRLETLAQMRASAKPKPLTLT